MRSQYDEWIAGDPAGGTKAPSKQIVCEWVVRAWERLDAEIIRKSMKACGVTNVLTGEEDSLIVSLRDFPNALEALAAGRKIHQDLNDDNNPYVVLDDDFDASTDEDEAVDEAVAVGSEGDDDFEIEIM